MLASKFANPQVQKNVKSRTSLFTYGAFGDVPTPACLAYGAFMIVAFVVGEYVAERSYSVVLTMSALAQCLGLTLLTIQVTTFRSAKGISARSLALDGLAALLRLSSTLFRFGYLPTDATGDYLYQLFDTCSLLLILGLLRLTLVVHNGSYEEEEDSFRVVPMVVACFVGAIALHGDMNNSPFFDVIWMAGLFVSVVAVLPQYWMIMRNGGKAEVMTAHYIAAMAIGRIFSGMFMWEARMDITCIPYIGDFQHAIFAILSAHTIHVLLLSDFFYHYAVAIVRNGGSMPRSPNGSTLPLTFEVDDLAPLGSSPSCRSSAPTSSFNDGHFI